MSIWFLIIPIQLLLLFAWWRAAKFWVLINKANVFLRKSKLFLTQHKFEEEVKSIKEERIPKYSGWKLDTFLAITLIWLIFTLLPIIGAAVTETGESSVVTNGVITFFLALIGYNWNLMKIRVDILNIECDYIDNLVNIVKSNDTSLQNE